MTKSLWTQATTALPWWTVVACNVLQQSKQEVILAELKICISLRSLKRGKQVHEEAIRSGNHAYIYIATGLVHMYAKCSSMADAHEAFDYIKQPDVVAWNALILGYAENGQGATALDLFASMRSQGCVPNALTFIAALKSCTCLALEQDGSRREECLQRGKQIHSEAGSCSDVRVQSALIDMYAKCGAMVHARQVFDSIKKPDVVSWTALMLGYTDNGEGLVALDLFATMKFQGCAPDRITFVAALKACSSVALEQDGRGKAECLERGKQILLQLRDAFGCVSDIYVQNTSIDMYAKCGSMIDARQVFDGINRPDVVSWNALISGYADNNEAVTALDLFAKMGSQGFVPDSITFVAVLKACGSLGALECGSKIHAVHNVILVTSQVDFYAKCGNLIHAQRMFDAHPERRSLKTWNALLAGYSRLGDNKVFQLFEAMKDESFLPNDVTFLCILTCCNHAGLLEEAEGFFQEMCSSYKIIPNVEHYTCIVDIYSRYEKLDDAMALLMSMPCKPDSVTWMTVLGSCRKWKNFRVGRLAFTSLVCLEHTNAAAYVLMACIYRSRGMWLEQAMVLEMRKKSRSWMAPEESSWVSENGKVHIFKGLQSSRF